MFMYNIVTEDYGQVVKVDETNRGRRTMKTLVLSGFVIVFASAIFALSPVWGQDKNLSLNPEVTAHIQALDQVLFQGFDVYFSGASTEIPTALLFDIKDDYHLPSPLWEKPISNGEVIYAIHRLDEQYLSREWDIPFEPRALNIVNNNGETLGYIYTGVRHVSMDRKKDGRVTVFRPTPLYFNWGGYGQSVSPAPPPP
jgi:hypothetical protein